MLNILRIMLLVSFMYCSTLWAHATPQQQTPGPGQVISSGATTVNITFDSQIEPVFSTLKVTDQRGRQVSRGKGSVSGSTLRTSLPKLSSGSYQVYWSVVSNDGHRTQGSYSFSVR